MAYFSSKTHQGLPLMQIYGLGDCMYDMIRRNLPLGSLPYFFFEEWQRTFYVQCPIDRTSHTWPLKTLMGVQGEESDNMGSKPIDCFCHSATLSGPSTNRESYP